MQQSVYPTLPSAVFTLTKCRDRFVLFVQRGSFYLPVAFVPTAKFVYRSHIRLQTHRVPSRMPIRFQILHRKLYIIRCTAACVH